MVAKGCAAQHRPPGAAGLGLGDRFDDRTGVLGQLLKLNPSLPTGTCRLDVLSILNSTRPALNSLTALAVSWVTVPVFGLGMRPRGPSTLPSLRTSTMASGRGDRHIKVTPPFLALLDKVIEPDVLGTGGLRGIGRLARLREDHHANDLAAAVRQSHRAPNHLVGLRGSTPGGRQGQPIR
jgi:hypothetical protein